MIYFANEMQQKLIASKENKILLAVGAGAGSTTALYFKAISELSNSKNCVFISPAPSMCHLKYKEFKSKFQDKDFRYSDKSMIVTNQETGAKMKFMMIEPENFHHLLYLDSTIFIDGLYHYNNYLNLLSALEPETRMFSSIYAYQCNQQYMNNLFDSIISNYDCSYNHYLPESYKETIKGLRENNIVCFIKGNIT